jgi:hypothetical protein
VSWLLSWIPDTKVAGNTAKIGCFPTVFVGEREFCDIPFQSALRDSTWNEFTLHTGELSSLKHQYNQEVYDGYIGHLRFLGYTNG